MDHLLLEPTKFRVSKSLTQDFQCIEKHCTNALNILDRFHSVAKLNLALDEVRASEAMRLVQDGYEPVLKKSRWCLLKRSTNPTPKQRGKLRYVLRYNLQSVRAYLFKEYFRARKQFSSGIVEGLNNKAKVTMRKAYGFRTFEILELALYHVLGKSPEPKLTHPFY
ncbi:transposase [Ferrovum myxofaciens]|uniref:transposase n=1 Tax=Ferrovum myxofaciens TaxID=416213 RepID=UPI003B591D7F